MPTAGFEPTIPANEWPQTHALDRAVTGIGCHAVNWKQIKVSMHSARNVCGIKLCRMCSHLLRTVGETRICTVGFGCERGLVNRPFNKFLCPR